MAMRSIKLDMTKNIILHTVAWILLFLLPPFLFESFERISTIAPGYYYFSCLLLIPIYYISRIYLLQKKSIIYIIVVIVCFLVYLYLPELIFKVLLQNDSLVDLIDISGNHRLNRMRIVNCGSPRFPWNSAPRWKRSALKKTRQNCHS